MSHEHGMLIGHCLSQSYTRTWKGPYERHEPVPAPALVRGAYSTAETVWEDAMPLNEFERLSSGFGRFPLPVAESWEDSIPKSKWYEVENALQRRPQIGSQAGWEEVSPQHERTNKCPARTSCKYLVHSAYEDKAEIHGVPVAVEKTASTKSGSGSEQQENGSFVYSGKDLVVYREEIHGSDEDTTLLDDSVSWSHKRIPSKTQLEASCSLFEVCPTQHEEDYSRFRFDDYDVTTSVRPYDMSTAIEEAISLKKKQARQLAGMATRFGCGSDEAQLDHYRNARFLLLSELEPLQKANPEVDRDLICNLIVGSPCGANDCNAAGSDSDSEEIHQLAQILLGGYF